jgi:cobalt transporter subunit CbtA
MIFRIFFSALAAGLLSAVLITQIQAFVTTPMIIQAETYETSSGGHDHSTHNHDEAQNDKEEQVASDDAQQEEWGPQDGLERHAYSFLANLAVGIGFSLLLIVGLTFEKAPFGASRGVLWGFAGFAVFTMAPNLGLPPELPTMPAADLTARQIWWLATILFSAAGFGITVFGKSTIIKILGLVLLALPHIWGAPHATGDSGVPPELAAHFAASTIVLSALFWVMIGYFSSLVFNWVGEKQQKA